MNRRILLGASLVFLLASTASAWEPLHPNRPVWRGGPVSYALHRAGSEDLGGFSATEPIVRQAMEDWTRVSCTSLRTNYRGMTNATPGSSDRASVVGWVESRWRHHSSAIGVTGSQFGPGFGGWEITEADIEMNGVDFNWTVGGGGGWRNVDTYSITLHEAGHFFGLDHTNVPGSTMWPSYSGGVVSLGPDDEAGICALYPAGGSSDCTVTGCPIGQECVSGSCRPVQGDGSMCSICNGHQDCNGSSYCLTYPDGGHYCGPTCNSNADCGGDTCAQTTNGLRVCVRYDGGTPSCAGSASGCTTDSECASNEMCSAGSCIPRPNTGNDLGGACAADSECKSGLCLGGVCTQSCNWLEPTSCPAGFYCDADASTSCSAGYCMAGSAGSGTLGASCSNDTECASLFCDRGICTTPCQPGGVVACAEGYSCQPGILSCRGSCQRRRDLGDACESNGDCATDMCASREGDTFCTRICDASNPCPAGFSCTQAGDHSVCVPDAGGLDDACVDDDDCISGICTSDRGASYCTRGCEPPCPQGFTCGNSESHAAVCLRTEPGLGQDCDENRDCASGLCVVAGMDTFCTEVCTDRACPNGFECQAAGDTEVCVPLHRSAGGCGCSMVPSGGFGLGAPALLALLALVWRRRRQT